MKSLLDEVRHGEPEGVARLICRYLRPIDPSAVDVAEKVVAWFRPKIGTGQIKSPSTVLRTVRFIVSHDRGEQGSKATEESGNK